MANDAVAQSRHRQAWLRHGLKALHLIAAIGIGGGLAACVAINLTDAASADTFIAGRQAVAAIKHYVLVPSLAAVLISGLLAIAATPAYKDAGWAWLKALLGLSLFEATLVTVGGARTPAELASTAADPALVAALLRSERQMLWLLLALCVANVVLAVWRPRLMYQVR